MEDVSTNVYLINALGFLFNLQSERDIQLMGKEAYDILRGKVREQLPEVFEIYDQSEHNIHDMTVGMDLNFMCNGVKYCMQYGDAKMQQTPSYIVDNKDLVCVKEPVEQDVYIEGFIDYKIRWKYGSTVKSVNIDFFVNEEDDYDEENKDIGDMVK